MTMATQEESVKRIKSISSDDNVFLLNAVAQNYEWGHMAPDSEVALLKKEAGHDIDPSKPYAELWMGTHPSGPSTIDPQTHPGFDQLPLSSLITNHPNHFLGQAASIFGNDLPFLFKVLSIRTALSIQSHPDKSLAQRLHNERPQIYKDGNHKPEMAIALSNFEALCGFCSHQELVDILTHVPELRDCCGEDECINYIESSEDTRKEALQRVFTRLMTADTELVKKKTSALVQRLHRESGIRLYNDSNDNTNNTTDDDNNDNDTTIHRALTPKEHLVLRLNQQYPDDVGILASYFLNFLQLHQGQAVVLPANEPHAYISGTIVECMATSDNVIRAGLTPKLRDTDVLCASLTYNQGFPRVLEGEVHDSIAGMKVYRPPFEEFEVWNLHSSKSDGNTSNGSVDSSNVMTNDTTTTHDTTTDDNNNYTIATNYHGIDILIPKTKSTLFPAANGPMIILVQKANNLFMKPENGLLRALNRGDVLFVSAGTSFRLIEKDGDDAMLWFAVPNGMWLK